MLCAGRAVSIPESKENKLKDKIGEAHGKEYVASGDPYSVLLYTNSSYCTNPTITHHFIMSVMKGRVGG